MDTHNQEAVEKAEKKETQQLSLPSAIIIGSIIITIGLIINGSNISFKTGSDERKAIQAPEQVLGNPSALLENIRPVTAEDHIRGDINASILIVEYSDTECPFCKQFHKTLQQIMNEYGESKKVAWVYRHFPLDQLHPNARKQAEATECAYGIGGQEAFWKYTDRIYEITPSNNGLGAEQLPIIAQYAGLDVTAFNNCLRSGTFAQKVENDVINATETGGNGTPWSIIITQSGKKFEIGGALPYNQLKQIVDQALAEK